MAYSSYHKAICTELENLALNDKVIFMGQQTASEDMYRSLVNIPINRRIEMPLAEELQIGISIGLAMQGFFPVSIIQRMDFLLRAADQIVNHLNLIEELSRGIFSPKILIRTTIGSTSPLNCGKQHSQDFTEGFRKLVSFPIFKVETVEQVKLAYQFARESKTSVMIIEDQNLYYV